MTKLAWHFSNGNKLCYNDPRKIKLGEKLIVDPERLKPCEYGLHASEGALDALRYAPGTTLWRVELSGRILEHGNPVDKLCASERTAIAGGKNVSKMLNKFARHCALDVIHLWNVPPVVKECLETGNEALKEETAKAAYAAAYADYAYYAAAYHAAANAAANAAYVATHATHAAANAAYVATHATHAAANAAAYAAYVATHATHATHAVYYAYYATTNAANASKNSKEKLQEYKDLFEKMCLESLE